MTTIRYRLRTDFPLTIITLFGALAAFAFLPYSVYRFANGAMVHGLVDLVVVVAVALAVGHAWHTGRTRFAGVFLSLISTAACLVTAMLPGALGLYWIYVALLANYFLVKRTEAAAMTAIALGVVAVYNDVFVSNEQKLAFMVSVLLVSLFAFIFAYRAELHRQQLETLATIDPLTGIGNRRAMESELQIAIQTHRRTGAGFGLAMLDLDHFKRINDEFGHEAGDQVLVDFATLVRAHTRQVDRLFRFGGEEFVLLIPGADAAALSCIADKLCAMIAARLQCKDRPITLSIGATALRPDDDAPAWLARADAALYRAKHAGRNRAAVDAQVGAPPPV